MSKKRKYAALTVLAIMTLLLVPACAEGTVEDPEESLHIAEAVEDTVGTPDEAGCLGYNLEPVLLAVMGESGGESDQFIREIATCVANEAARRCITPEEAVEQYQLVKARRCSQRVRDIVVDVLIYGNFAPEVSNATMFYNVDLQIAETGYCSTDHERNREVLEVTVTDGTRVRFFEEIS